MPIYMAAAKGMGLLNIPEDLPFVTPKTQAVFKPSGSGMTTESLHKYSTADERPASAAAATTGTFILERLLIISPHDLPSLKAKSRKNSILPK